MALGGGVVHGRGSVHLCRTNGLAPPNCRGKVAVGRASRGYLATDLTRVYSLPLPQPQHRLHVVVGRFIAAQNITITG